VPTLERRATIPADCTDLRAAWLQARRAAGL